MSAPDQRSGGGGGGDDDDVDDFFGPPPGGAKPASSTEPASTDAARSAGEGARPAGGTARRAAMLETAAPTGPRAREGSSLSSSLAARGFALERFDDARAALEALATTPFDIVVVDADSPGLEMRGFVEALRRDPRTAHTLVVALASGDPREIPARREIALTLAKPINADEAASRLEGLVVTRQRAATNARELRGDLSQLPLPDLLQLLAVSRASGTLAVEAAARRGALVLDSGDIKLATCGPTTGLKAFVRLLMLTEGAFVFTHGAVESPAGSDAGAGAGGGAAAEVLALGPALFEATRQIDEIARLRPTLPEPWMEVRRARGELSPEARTRVAGSALAGELLRVLETPRTLAALLDASSGTDAETLAALEVLRGAGAVEVAGASTGGRLAVLDGPYAAALAARLSEGGQTPTARVLILVDPVPGAASDASAVARALVGIADFAPAEGVLASALPLGTLGTLALGAARLELFAVPAEPELSPLWSVFGARAHAAVVAAPSPEAWREEKILGGEVGLPLATLSGPVEAASMAAALRAALEQLIPRR